MGRPKSKMFNRKGHKKCCGCSRFKPLEDFYDKGKASYCRPCLKEYNSRRYHARKHGRKNPIAAMIEARREKDLNIIREHFNKAYEAALINSDYKHHLVNSIAATDDFLYTGSKDNQHTINQYSELRYGRA